MIEVHVTTFWISVFPDCASQRNVWGFILGNVKLHFKGALDEMVVLVISEVFIISSIAGLIFYIKLVVRIAHLQSKKRHNSFFKNKENAFVDFGSCQFVYMHWVHIFCLEVEW